MDDRDVKTAKIAYDVTTLMRVLPWLLVDKRSPQHLVKAALTDSRGFIESNVDDKSRDRAALLKGLIYNWGTNTGHSFDASTVEALARLITTEVDDVYTTLYDDGLKGDKA